MLRSARNFGKSRGLACMDKTRTVVSQALETDINEIMRRFGKTGMLPQGVARPILQDFTEITDFRSAMDTILMAKHSFMQMPAEVRDRFGNSPEAFVNFCSDDANIDEMRKLGIAVPPEKVVESPELLVLKEIRDVGKSKANAGKAPGAAE